MKIWNVNIDDKVISKLTETKTNSKYSIEYLDKIIKPQVFILPNMSRYVDTFKVKDRDEDNSSKLLLFIQMMKNIKPFALRLKS